ncbi:hypothetical protein [Pseudophaeobacter sp. C1-32P7]|uniref:hypothetical protein n=1 Tax=Pseudophaeobacter sp. C1-32P7 TaxID=3098142 RepID=UPI0034D5E329
MELKDIPQALVLDTNHINQPTVCDRDPRSAFGWTNPPNLYRATCANTPPQPVNLITVPENRIHEATALTIATRPQGLDRRTPETRALMPLDQITVMTRHRNLTRTERGRLPLTRSLGRHHIEHIRIPDGRPATITNGLRLIAIRTYRTKLHRREYPEGTTRGRIRDRVAALNRNRPARLDRGDPLSLFLQSGDTGRANDHNLFSHCAPSATSRTILLHFSAARARPARNT